MKKIIGLVAVALVLGVFLTIHQSNVAVLKGGDASTSSPSQLAVEGGPGPMSVTYSTTTTTS